MAVQRTACPCGLAQTYLECCGRYIESGQFAPNAEALMRSRYTAYTLLNEEYLLATWHPSHRPATLNLASEVATRWLGLSIQCFQPSVENQAEVEFIARYKINGRAHRLHENSRFVAENGQWFYVDGELF